MIVGFKFTTPTDSGRFTMMSPGLILAYRETVVTKRNKILYWAIVTALCLSVLMGNIFKFTGIMQGDSWFITLLVFCVVSLGVLLYSITWTGPQATLLYAAIETEGFGDYLKNQIELMEQAIRPENIKLAHLTYKTVKHMQRTIASMEALLEISDGLQEVEDLYAQIDFLRGFTGLYGFEVRDITKEAINAKK